MNAIMAIQQPDSFWYEARRYCDEHDLGPESVEKIAQALRCEAYRDAIQPLIKLKTDFYLAKIPRIIRHADGRIESIYDWSEEERKAFAQVDALIADVARRQGLTQEGDGRG